MNKFFKKIVLFGFFFFTSLIIGYDSISRYDYDKLLKIDGALSDIITYKRIVENGLNGVEEEKRVAPRLLTPLLSHYVYKFSKDKIGSRSKSWNHAFFSLLIVNSFFVSMICLLMGKFHTFLNIREDKEKILSNNTSQFIFLTSFGVVNIFLSGLIDSSESFFFLLFIYSFLLKKYYLVTFSIILLAFSKESSFVYISLFLFSYFFLQIFIEKKIIIKELFYAIIFFALNIIIINSYILYFLKMNFYQYLFHFVDTGGAKYYIKNFSDLPRFFIFIIPSLFFVFRGAKFFKKKFITIIFIMSLTFLIFFLFIFNIDGIAMGRYFFNFIGPIICLISGLGFNLFFHQNEKNMNQSSK